jgi:hypothetical protein
MGVAAPHTLTQLTRLKCALHTPARNTRVAKPDVRPWAQVADYGTRAASLADASSAGASLALELGGGGAAAGGASIAGAAGAASLAAVHLGDARQVLPSVAAAGSVAGVLASPPYPCVYDYVSHARGHRALLTRYSGTRGVAVGPSKGRPVVQTMRKN